MASSPAWDAELVGLLDSQTEQPDYFLDMALDRDNSTAVENENSDAKECLPFRSSNKVRNNGNYFEDSESYIINLSREADEIVGFRGDGSTTGDEGAGVFTRDEMHQLNNNMRQILMSNNDDDNYCHASGVRDSQGKYSFLQERKSLQTTKYREQSELETDVKLSEAIQKQRPVAKDGAKLSDQDAAEKESKTPAASLKHAIDVLEENLDQLRDLYVEQEIKKSRNALEVDPVEEDQNLINCLQRDLFSCEQQLLTIQTDLQIAQRNIDVLNTEKLNLTAQLAYERQIGALCLQSVTDQLTRISSMMETGNGYNCSSPSLTPVKQAALKTELGKLVKVLESEELRLTEALESNTSGNTDKKLANNYVCLKPVEQSIDSKYSSTGVFHQKRIRPTSVGIVRCRSAPVKSTSPNLSVVNLNDLGQGKDYFQTLYREVKHRQEGGTTRTSNHQSDKNLTTQLLTRPLSSALHDLHIIEIQPDGKFVQIANSSNTVDHQIGNYILQQNIGGHPVAVFPFPPRVNCPPLSTVTVWSEGCEAALHHPPSNFIFKGKPKWSTGSHVSTILCRPNGQAVAWSTALPKQYFQQAFLNSADKKKLHKLPSSENSVFGREKNTLEKSLYTNEPPTSLEPQASETVIKTSSKSNAIPGLPFAGASGRRLGSASLRRYHARPFSATLL